MNGGNEDHGPAKLTPWRRPVSWALVAAARLYQQTLSPLVGRQCRFQPTCSQYFIEAVTRRGAVRGGLLGLWRICRCQPFGKGGYDPVPEAPQREKGGFRRKS